MTITILTIVALIVVLYGLVTKVSQLLSPSG
jgi:hypothetical protein